LETLSLYPDGEIVINLPLTDWGSLVIFILRSTNITHQHQRSLTHVHNRSPVQQQPECDSRRRGPFRFTVHVGQYVGGADVHEPEGGSRGGEGEGRRILHHPARRAEGEGDEEGGDGLTGSVAKIENPHRVRSVGIVVSGS
jgi:hypothetical protein